MIIIPLKKGDTLHILNTGPSHAQQIGHLHIILTNECTDGNHLLVPISTKRPNCDTTCLLGKGDHPFIVHDSFVFYARTQIYPAKHIKERIINGDITRRDPFEERVFGYICKGLLESRHLPPIAQKYYQQNSGR